MTYKEAFMQAETVEDLIDMVKHECHVAVFLLSDNVRLKNIEKAANEVIDEKGWDISQEKYDDLFGDEDE